MGFQTVPRGLRETLVAAPVKAVLRVYSATTVTGEGAFEEFHEVEILEGETVKIDV